MKNNFSACLLSLLAFLCSIQVKANIRLPEVISSHMVLQQKTNVKLWGWCEPSEKIKIKTSWDTTTYTATGTNGAKWMTPIKTPAAGGPYTITLTGNNTVVLDDVMIGEVWLCSGQSNMEMSVSWGLPYNDDVAAATNKNIRFFHIPKATAQYPQENVTAHWVVCNPEDMKRFSAAGYFFGKKIQETLGVPVGLINSSWGGTPAEVWTPDAVVIDDTGLNTAAKKINPAGGWPNTPGATYNAMIYPLINYNIAGALWYQGESNTSTAATYPQLLTGMIDSWRKAWGSEFPFYLVQIAPFTYGSQNIGALLREAQTKISTYPKTGMVVTSDLVDNVKDIHPKMKREVGLRLAAYALGDTYGVKDLAYKSPQYKSMKVERNKIRIYVDNAGKGLTTKNGTPTEFYIAGEDKVFVPATAKIEGNTIVVWNKDVKAPVAVRFGFSNTAMPNVFSKDGLPLNLFRTDDWTVETGPGK